MSSNGSITPADAIARVSGRMQVNAPTATASTVTPNETSSVNYAGLDPKLAQAETDPAKATLETPELDPGWVRHGAIVRAVRAHWEKNKYAKIVTDGRLLKCLRMARGEYSPAELTTIAATGANSTIYLKIAAVKSVAVVAWDMLKAKFGFN